MRLVVLDETIKECKGWRGIRSSGSITGRVWDTMLEKHIHIAELLPILGTRRAEVPQWIGEWKICELSASTAPTGEELVELFLSPDSDDLLAFYKGQRVKDIHIANYRTDFSARMQGIVDCELLTEKRALIIGAGSVGSKMAMHLTRAGVGKFTLIDFDIVEAANLCRCEYSVEDIGRCKTLALQDKVLGVNPWARVEALQENVMDMVDDKLLWFIERSDIVVSAADDLAVEQRLNALAHSLVSVVYPALYSRASGGEVIFTVPGGPCYQCVVGTLRSVSEAPSRGEWDYTTAGDLKAEPGLGIDIDHVVVIASKIALALLMQEVESSDMAMIIDRKRTVIFVSNKNQEMYRHSFRAFETVLAETEVNKDCVVCQARKGRDEALLSKVRDQVAKATVVDFPEITEYKI